MKVKSELQQIKEFLILKFNQIDERLDKIESKLNKIGSRLDNVESRLDKVESRLDKIELRLDKIEDRLEKVEHQVKELKIDMDNLKQLNYRTNLVLTEDFKPRLDRLEEDIISFKAINIKLVDDISSISLSLNKLST